MKHVDLFKRMGTPHLTSIQVKCYSNSWSNNSYWMSTDNLSVQALIIIANIARLA